MSLLGKLKDAVWEDDKPKVPSPTAAAASVVPASTAVVVPATPTFVVPATPAASAVDDSEFLKAVAEALAGSALPEYDYMKFMAGTTELAAVIADERTRFMTVFLSVKSIGVSKEKLGETAKHYLTVIDEQRNDFLNELSKQLKEKVEQKEQSISKMDADMKAKQDQISQLQADISAVKLQRDELATKVQESRSQIESAKAAFESACTKSTMTINENVEKINRYLS